MEGQQRQGIIKIIGVGWEQAYDRELWEEKYPNGL